MSSPNSHFVKDLSVMLKQALKKVQIIANLLRCQKKNFFNGSHKKLFAVMAPYLPLWLWAWSFFDLDGLAGNSLPLSCCIAISLFTRPMTLVKNYLIRHSASNLASTSEHVADLTDLMTAEISWL